jgi:plastocyanin
LTSIDNVGIIVTVVIVVATLGFLATGGTGIPSDISPTIEKSTASIKEASKETVEKFTELSESSSKIIVKTSEKTKQTVERVKEASQTAKELSTSKLPARMVSIPYGTSLPGCEKDGICYDPPSLIIFKGGETIWKNDDTSVHTVSSGNIIDGPDGLFESGLIMPGKTFSHKFEEAGEYDYFCMIHP